MEQDSFNFLCFIIFITNTIWMTWNIFLHRDLDKLKERCKNNTPKFCPVCGCANDTIVGTDMIKQVTLYICDPAKNTRCRDKIDCQTLCRHTTDIRFARDFEKIPVGDGDYCFVQKEDQ